MKTAATPEPEDCADDRQQPKAPPRVFVSYAQESPEHKRWVAQLATDLRAHGVDAILDQWNLQLGDDLTLFMERGIRTADRVLLVCTPAYARKANGGEGGVGYERLVVTGELAAKIDTNKFVCVLRAGTKADSIPTFAATRLFVDFTDDGNYPASLEELLRDIHDAPALPKPPIGANPFSGSSLAPIAATLLHPVQTSVESSNDIEELYSRATRLLRDKDLVGWKQLVRNVRRELPRRLQEWRKRAEDAIRGKQKDWADWFATLSLACHETSPLMMLALCAVDSEIECLSDQRALLDDLYGMPEWVRAGTTIVIEAPAGLAYLFHNILGAFLVSSNRQTEAVRLLRSRIPIEFGSPHVGEIWRSPPMMGWGESFGEDLDRGWQFLNSAWERHPWLAHFFARRDDFCVGLRAYNLLAGIVELAQRVSSGNAVTASEESWRQSVPPVFLTTISGGRDVPSTSKLLSMAVPDRRVLREIADEHGCDPAQLRDSWSRFYASWVNKLDTLFNGRYWVVTSAQLPIPELP
jgi:hypothetical protein